MAQEKRAQVWAYAAQYRRPRHFHAEPELNLVVAGCATFGIGDSTVQVGAGELLSFLPGQDHALLEASRDLELFAIGVGAALSSEVLGSSEGVATAAPPRVRLTRAELDPLVRRITAVVGLSGVEQPVAELWEAAHRARANALSSCSARHVLTRRSLAAIQRSPEISRAALSRDSRACPSEISRHFHRDLGLTLLSYRTRVRLLRLIELVDARAANLTSAAFQVGFGSYSQFHRAFQATLGCAPSRFFDTELRQRMESAFEPLSGALLQRPGLLNQE
jgi:AraC-like DNA-binding protein